MADTAPVAVTLPGTITPAVPPTPVKPGYLTTEFYLSAFAMLLGLAYTSGIIATGSSWDHMAGMAVTLLAGLGYTVTRGRVKAAMAALCVMSLLGNGAVMLTACGSAGQRTSAGVKAFLDCESPHVDAAMLADAKVLATSAASKWISGSGTIDAAGLKADAAPLKTDLLRCAFDAAMAALVTPVPATPGAPASSARTADSAQVTAAWGAVRARLGWPAQAPQ